MEQYSNLNVHGKITQKAAQGTNSDDVVKYPTLTERVPATLPTPAAANEGKAIISNGSGYEFGEAGKVDAVQINGTAIAGDGTQTKVANIIPGSGLTSSGATINHSNSVTAETTGKGSSTAIPIIKYDAQGHITEVTTVTVYPPTTAGTSGQVWKSDGSGQGAWTALKTINSGSLVGSGNISLQTPLTAGTDYVAHNSTTASQVYATNGSKVDTPIPYSTGATQGHIVQRGTEGQITVPSTPSADTDAASKAFVNSSVGTNTATFRGTYNAVSDLGNTQATVDAWVDPPTSTIETLVAGQIATKLASLSVTPENNDYVFVSVDQTPVGDLGEDWYWRFKYSDPNNDHTGSWGYEYTLNNSSFTQAQWDAVNSGITADKVSKLDGIQAGAEVNVQADWNQTNTGADDYIKNKPTIPTIPDVSVTVTGSGNAVSSASASGHAITLTKGITAVTKTGNSTANQVVLWNGTDSVVKASNQSALTPGVSIATDSGTNALTMAHATKYKLTVGASTFIFTTPSDNNTDTLVKQTAQASTTTSYPLLASAQSSPTSGTAYEAKYSTSCYIKSNEVYSNGYATWNTNSLPFAATDVTLADM